jgi:hypothetical protein
MILDQGQTFGSYEMLKDKPKFFTAKVKSSECEIIRIKHEYIPMMNKMLSSFVQKLKDKSISQFNNYLKILNAHPMTSNSDSQIIKKKQSDTTHITA